MGLAEWLQKEIYRRQLFLGTYLKDARVRTAENCCRENKVSYQIIELVLCCANVMF